MRLFWSLQKVAYATLHFLSLKFFSAMFKNPSYLVLFMKKRIALFAVLLALLLLVLLTGCGTQHIYLCSDGTVAGNEVITKSKVVYHCPSGNLASDISQCSFSKQNVISEDQARENALNYVEAYVSSAGWKVTFINAYAEEGNWYAQLVIAKRGEEPYQTLVSVDGKRGSVSCLENCPYTP